MESDKYLKLVEKSDLKSFTPNIVYNVEYEYFRKLVLLNDLKKLFKEKDKTFSFTIESLRGRYDRQFKKVCTETYNFLYLQNNTEQNSKLIKTEFSSQYNFITAKKFKITGRYKDYYKAIVNAINQCKRKLIEIRLRINDIKKDFSPEDYDLIPINLILQKGGEKIKTEVKNKISTLEKKKFQKFIWKKSKSQLELLFDELIFNGYVSEFDLNTLTQHFIISSDKSEDKHNDRLEKINWKTEKSEFPFFIEYLLNKEAITKQGRGIHTLSEIHFTIGGDNINIRSITSLASKVRSMNPKPRNYIEIQNLIDKIIK